MRKRFFLALYFLSVAVPCFSETLTPTLINRSIAAQDGTFIEKETDLRIPGRAPAPSGAGRGFDYEFTRVYRSRISYDGPLGANWDHNYNKRLIEREDGNVARFDGEARFDIYEKLSDGTYKSPSGYFDTLVKNADGTFTIRDKHGTVYNYATDGWIAEIRDRNNNAMRFEFVQCAMFNVQCSEGEKRLTKVIDTVGREILYAYDEQARLISVTDFSGRVIRFEYSPQGDLISVTNPAGHAVRYAYSSGYGEDRKELNHNLLTVTDAKGQTYLKNEYSIYDRVCASTLGTRGRSISNTIKLPHRWNVQEPSLIKFSIAPAFGTGSGMTLITHSTAREIRFK